jgi:hypothetical protein
MGLKAPSLAAPRGSTMKARLIQEAAAKFNACGDPWGRMTAATERATFAVAKEVP